MSAYLISRLLGFALAQRSVCPIILSVLDLQCVQSGVGLDLYWRATAHPLLYVHEYSQSLALLSNGGSLNFDLPYPGTV